MRSAIITGAMLLIVASAARAVAEQRGVSLQVAFQETEISIASHQAVTGVVDFAGGATTGRHLHGGEMVGYVISGSLVLEQDGTAPRVLNAGETFVIPAGAVHSHTNRGQSPARMFVTYIVDKNRAVTTAVR